MTEKSGLRECAREVYERRNAHDVEAVNELLIVLKKHRLVRELCEYGASMLLHERMRASRGRVGLSVVPSVSRGDCDVAAYARDRVRWRIGCWPLTSGVKLADATEAEICEQIEIHSRNERGNAMARTFLEKVLALRRERGVDPEAPCRKGLSEEEIAAAHAKAYGYREEVAHAG